MNCFKRFEITRNIITIFVLKKKIYINIDTLIDDDSDGEEETTSNQQNKQAYKVYQW